MSLRVTARGDRPKNRLLGANSLSGIRDWEQLLCQMLRDLRFKTWGGPRCEQDLGKAGKSWKDPGSFSWAQLTTSKTPSPMWSLSPHLPVGGVRGCGGLCGRGGHRRPSAESCCHLLDRPGIPCLGTGSSRRCRPRQGTELHPRSEQAGQRSQCTFPAPTVSEVAPPPPAVPPQEWRHPAKWTPVLQ